MGWKKEEIEGKWGNREKKRERGGMRGGNSGAERGMGRM